MNEEGVYLLDSFPLPACDNIRIRRCRLYREEHYRGYQASKRRFFYGLKVHLLVTASGAPGGALPDSGPLQRRLGLGPVRL